MKNLLNQRIKTHLFLLMLFCSVTVFGREQVKLTKLDITELPSNIKYEGKIKDAVRWTDNLGDNIVITTETGYYQSKKGNSAELFAYHFIVSNDTVKQTWRVYDFFHDCPTDMYVNFLKNTFQVTDLDNDGIAEIWLMYKTGCSGGVDPFDMKIIMYHGQQKFAMRGQDKVQVSDTDFAGGEYKFDSAFIDGPTVFKEFAKNLWVNNMLHQWGK